MTDDRPKTAAERMRRFRERRRVGLRVISVPISEEVIEHLVIVGRIESAYDREAIAEVASELVEEYGLSVERDA